MVSPVLGFLPSLAALSATLKFPNPTSWTLSPDFRALAMASKVASTVLPASAFEVPVAFATAAIRSLLLHGGWFLFRMKFYGLYAETMENRPHLGTWRYFPDHRRGQKWKSGGNSGGMLCISVIKLHKKQSSRQKHWRRGWDSNPRYPQRYNGFRDRPVRPLRHPSQRPAQTLSESPQPGKKARKSVRGTRPRRR